MPCLCECILPKMWRFLVALAAVLAVSHSIDAASPPDRFSPSAPLVAANAPVPAWIQAAQGRGSRSIDENLREWQSLSPEEKEQMRRRMQQLNRMEPEDRRHFQRLFEQWQQLSPQERRQIESALEQWDRLSPEEREAIRRRFRR